MNLLKYILLLLVLSTSRGETTYLRFDDNFANNFAPEGGTKEVSRVTGYTGTISSSSKNSVTIQFTSPGKNSFVVSLAAPIGKDLEVTDYPDANKLGKGTINFFEENKPSIPKEGWFKILEIERGPLGQITSLAAEFQHIGKRDGYVVVNGSLRFNSSVPPYIENEPMYIDWKTIWIVLLILAGLIFWLYRILKMKRK